MKSTPPTKAYRTAALLAAGEVAKAVNDGTLANLKKTHTSCADCGARATQYDHRDYSKPLEVDAVCAKCNGKRGKAQFVPGKEYDVQALVSAKIPRSTYLTVKAMAKDRGCFIGKIISDAVNLLNSTNKQEQPKESDQVAA